ncbi:MAG: chemotaxis protein CheB [Tsuneonella troitsensis]
MFAQDAATSAVWGMPRAVAEAGLATAVLPPVAIAHRVAALAVSPPCTADHRTVRA